MERRRLEPEYFSKAGGSSHFPQVTLHLLRLHRHASWPPPSEKTTLKDFHPSYVLFFRNPVYQTTDAIRGRGCSGEVDHPVGYRLSLLLSIYSSVETYNSCRQLIKSERQTTEKQVRLAHMVRLLAPRIPRHSSCGK